MMEPYAYGGSDYRVGKYLTYELTIPKDAKSFSINNGEGSSDPYGFYTARTNLYDGSDTANGKGKKNYGNYFCIDNYNNGAGATLKQWKNGPEGIPKETYEEKDVESDYDYIYFEKPSDWNDHVYAYFYGGGDLRAHNWQRGVYSIWPGVAPVATEYSVTDGTDTAQHSDHYTYEYTETLFSETPTNSGNLTDINPESTFQYDGGTVYKFKIPKSERVTYENNGKRVYDKVI